jgi:hypothetical protein
MGSPIFAHRPASTQPQPAPSINPLSLTILTMFSPQCESPAWEVWPQMLTLSRLGLGRIKLIRGWLVYFLIPINLCIGSKLAKIRFSLGTSQFLTTADPDGQKLGYPWPPLDHLTRGFLLGELPLGGLESIPLFRPLGRLGLGVY